MPSPKPEWLRIKIRNNDNLRSIPALLERLSLHTVCEEANCPNRMECFSKKTATFMILGRLCTRNCTFCNVEKAPPAPPDPAEPGHIAQAVTGLELRHTVITSVTRDDLPDGGAEHFAKTIAEIRRADSRVVIEVLIPDFSGNREALETVAKAGPEIINHNVETVPRLYPEVRPQAVYPRSLELLRRIKEINPEIYSKSGLMLGLGEKEEEVLEVLRDLRKNSCDFLTLGQYLSPSKNHHPIAEYIHPDIFNQYREKALEMGFKNVASGPFVRSSYQAEDLFSSKRPPAEN